MKKKVIAMLMAGVLAVCGTGGVSVVAAETAAAEEVAAEEAVALEEAAPVEEAAAEEAVVAEETAPAGEAALVEESVDEIANTEESALGQAAIQEDTDDFAYGGEPDAIDDEETDNENTNGHNSGDENETEILWDEGSIEDAEITGIINKQYTGSPVKQNIKVTLEGAVLKEGTDYTVKYENNTKPGTATVKITGNGDYAGSATKTFLILPGKTSRGDMFNLANNVKVTWKEVPGAKYYKVYRSGVKEPVIVTSGLIGWDKQPGLVNGKKYTYKIVASLTGKGDSSGDSTLSYSKVMYRLKTVVIRSAKNTAPGKVTVTYDKTTSGDSYVLQYGERQDMVGARTKVVLGANNTSYVIGGLKKGKTYYISIRVRKKVNGIDYYTTFGVPRKVEIKQ